MTEKTKEQYDELWTTPGCPIDEDDAKEVWPTGLTKDNKMSNIQNQELESEPVLTKGKIRKKYREGDLTLDEAAWMLMEKYDLFQGESYNYLMA